MRRTLVCAAIAIVFGIGSSGAISQPQGAATDLSIAKVPLPGEGRGDYLSVDAAGNRLFVTHTTAVHILNLKTLQPVAEVTGLKYAHGVAVDRQGRGYVTDGDSNSVVVFDPTSGHALTRIAVGEKPDSILFDPASMKIWAFNGDSNSVSVIDPGREQVIATVKLPHPPENVQTDGRGHLYVNFEEGNAVGVVDTAKMALDHVIPLTGCEGPAPLGFDKANSRLFSGCGNNVLTVTAATTGKVVASVPIGKDPDGIVYDPGTRRIFVANRDGGWTIVHQNGPDDYTVERTLRIDEYAKTVALDPATHRVFSSTADLVWPPAVPGKKRLPNARPGTFRLLVVSQL